uniref:Histone domain-containing protein n=1 Tax=Panagrellus redivivus TaxID=6233 RepID=A0A7E4VE74_PANRE
MKVHKTKMKPSILLQYDECIANNHPHLMKEDPVINNFESVLRRFRKRRSNGQSLHVDPHESALKKKLIHRLQQSFLPGAIKRKLIASSLRNVAMCTGRLGYIAACVDCILEVHIRRRIDRFKFRIGDESLSTLAPHNMKKTMHTINTGINKGMQLLLGILLFLFGLHSAIWAGME